MKLIPRRTKIIATIGPASSDVEILSAMILAGVDLVRINFSHGTESEQVALINMARAAAVKANKEIGIIADLQGPKIRVGVFSNKKIELQVGQAFILDCRKNTPGDERCVGVDYLDLATDLTVNDSLLLNDGLIELLVERIEKHKIYCKVVLGGTLSNNKGINKKGGGLSASALTDKDLLDLKSAANAGVDYIAISFVRNAKDVEYAKKQIQLTGKYVAIIAKIERADAINCIDEIIRASDAVMVARGDLGVEIGLAQVPFEQKHIIERARVLGKAVITATQMMESMISQPQATRAEVSDVANAVLDGTDAVMLSGETAVGHYPLRVVETVADVCLNAEKYRTRRRPKVKEECRFNFKDEAIAMAMMYIANHYPINAIISLTESGTTALWISRIRSNLPIYALSRNIASLRKMMLYRGVYPIMFDPTQVIKENLIIEVIHCVKQKGSLSEGDIAVLSYGSLLGNAGGTDSMQVIDITR